MASSADFAAYICEQLEGVGAIRARKMFGEYMIYLNDKPVLMVCDDTVFVKRLPCLAERLTGRPTAPPYEGAKEHYVLDADDRGLLRETAQIVEEVTPLPKKKEPKPKKRPQGAGPVPWDVAWPQHMQPAMADIAAWVDSPLFPELNTWIKETYGVEPSIEFSRCSQARGWNVKYKRGSQSLCVLYVYAGWFAGLVTLGTKQLGELELLLPTFSAAFQKQCRETPTYKYGKWLFLDIREPAQLEELQRLILMKVKPAQKRS